MVNKLVVSTVMGIGSILLSAVSIADTPANTNATMPKDAWLKLLKEASAVSLCKGFTESAEINKQLVAANINYDKCLTLIPASYDACQTKLYADIPATIDNESAGKWGNSIGECIGADFATKYLVSSPAPATAPATAPAGSASTSTTITRDVWLAKLKTALPNLLCTGFLQDESLKKQMDTLKIDYDRCLTLIPASIDRCSTQLYSEIPANLDDRNGETWGNTLGECIGKDFAMKHLI